MKIPLEFKMGIGFLPVIIIPAIMSIMADAKVTESEAGITTLEDEYMPSVQIGAEINDAVGSAMNNMAEFHQTLSPDFVEQRGKTWNALKQLNKMALIVRKR